MATHGAEGVGLGDAARRVAEHATTLARLEARLALREVSRKLKELAAAAVLLTGAAVFGWFVLMTAIAAGIAAIALVLPVWAALLIVAGGLLVLSSVFGVVGLGLLKRSTPPVPEQAIREARLTAEALKNGRR